MHQAHAAAQNKTVHQGQDRFAIVVDSQVEGVLLDEEVLVQGVAAFETVMQRSNVAAGTEGFLASPAQGHGMDLRVFGPGIELALQQADHVQRDGVKAGGTVEGQVTNMVANLGQHFNWRGIHGRSPRRRNLSSHH